MTSTETALQDWRFGPTQAERLVSGVLRLEKFTNLQPQAPLGGGDGGADILCDWGRYRWVCAVYFPPTLKDFRAIREKFLQDLDGAITHKRNGFVFMTNQRLTKVQRQQLRDAAVNSRHECEVYDVERIRGVLDSSEGYGLRVGYLQIPMSLEEQVAFFATRENKLSDLMSEQSREVQTVLQHLKQLRQGQTHAAQSMQILANAQNVPIEPLRSFDPLAIGEITSTDLDQVFSQTITPAMVRLVHRLVCFDLPSRLIGHFRTENVVMMRAAATLDEPTISPADPTEIPQLIINLCEKWNSDIIVATTPDTKIEAVARFFHGILFIHPFLDGNGRMARAILMQQCIELFGSVDMSRFDRGAEYYSALQSADHSNFSRLKELIAQAVPG